MDITQLVAQNVPKGKHPKVVLDSVCFKVNPTELNQLNPLHILTPHHLYYDFPMYIYVSQVGLPFLGFRIKIVYAFFNSVTFSVCFAQLIFRDFLHIRFF